MAKPPDISARVHFLRAAAASISEPLTTTSAYIRASHDRLRSSIGESGFTEPVVTCSYCGAILQSGIQCDAQTGSSRNDSRASRRHLRAKKLAKSKVPEASVSRPAIWIRCERCHRLNTVQNLQGVKNPSRSTTSRVVAPTSKVATMSKPGDPIKTKKKASNKKQNSLQAILAQSKHVSSNADTSSLGLMDFMKSG